MPSLDELCQFLAGIPRLDLGLFPTPLVRLDRLSERLGVDLWMKRDECSGVALGGNKTRKLEYVLADARRQGANAIVTVGPVTSNHTMMTAAAARRAGFDIHCIVAGPPPSAAADWSGNLLLLDYVGATLHFCPMDFSNPTPEDGRRVEGLSARVTREVGGYFVPSGGTMPQAEPGYMRAVAEIAEQQGGRFDFDEVVVAYGTGSTTTGLLLGLAVGGFHSHVRAMAITTRYAVEECFRMKRPDQLFEESAEYFGLPFVRSDAPDHETVYGYADEGYGVPSAGADAAIRLMGSAEGYFLDPVYTAKAFYAMTELIREGRIARGARVLFVHTGGLSMTPASAKRYAPER